MLRPSCPPRLALLAALAGPALLACDEVGPPVAGTPDAGGGGACASALPQLTTRCDAPGCGATTGTRSFAIADLDADVARRWMVITRATSEIAVASDNTEVRYGIETIGGLRRAGEPTARPSRRVPSVEEAGRLAWHREIWAHPMGRRPDAAGWRGTAVRGRPDPRLPDGARRQAMPCDAGQPSVCGPTALCVIPEAAQAGTCEGALTLKFLGRGPTATDVAATVRAVGTHAAIVVDDADAAGLSDGDVDVLLQRFDTHVAPRLHGLFGEPKHQGRDRDGNGLAILFVTSRVRSVGAGVVGYFLPDDLRPTAELATSNAADLLYVAPPGGDVTLDALSGTIGHEYQHLINFTAKVIANGSEQEARWLDEGLSTFAEDVLGYGRDSFTNVLAYLRAVGDTSLTGFGLVAGNETEADGAERRGAAHLLVRHVFERAGGATAPAGGGGALVDGGGVAALRRVVQTDDTGIDALTAADGRSWADLLRDLALVVAFDGTELESCFPTVGFAPPGMDPFTSFQTGVDLRRTISVPGGTDIPLAGPASTPLESESVPLPVNGFELRVMSVPSGRARLTIGGPADAQLGVSILPAP